MSIIQQGSLFELQDILEWSRKDRFSTDQGLNSSFRK
jgi:hypothetical protein